MSVFFELIDSIVIEECNEVVKEVEEKEVKECVLENKKEEFYVFIDEEIIIFEDFEKIDEKFIF